MAIKKFNSVEGFSVGDLTLVDVIDANANVIANNFTVTTTANLGNVSNITITGGSANYVLKTDGAGNITFVDSKTVSVAGSNTEVQFNDAGVINASSSFTFNKSTNTLSVTNINVTSNSTLGNLATANYFQGNGSLITGLTLGSSLTDVVITSANNGQILGYNGVNWVNVDNNPTVGAGPGTGFWFTGPVIVATSANNDIQIDTLSSTPNTATQFYASVAINNTTDVITVLKTGALNRTVVDAGNWDFSIWANANATGGTQSIGAAVYQVIPYTAGTITVTGTGTTRTATASAGTPFVDVTAGANVATSSYLETPLGIYRITAKTSDTVVSINTPTGYTNESAVAGNVYNPLFTVNGATITSTNLTEYVLGTTEPSYNITTASGLGILVYGTTSSNRTLYIGLNGSQTSSHVATPLHTLHADLAGLQGGQSNEYYHLTTSEYTGTGTGDFVRKTSPALVTPNIGAANGTSLVLSGNLTSGNANLGNAATANYFIGDGSLLANLNPSNIGEVANANYAKYAGNVVISSQPNITSLGTLTGLSIEGTGNVSGANYISGNYLTGTLTTSSQPNITSVGTLSSLSVSGNITSGNIDGGNLVKGNYVQGTLTTANQPNITNVGTLGNLTVSGNVSANNVSITTLGNQQIAISLNGTIVGGPDLQWEFSNAALYTKALKVDTTIIANGNITANNANLGNLITANYLTGTLTTANQPNITNVGTLGNLQVTSNIISGNANLGNLTISTYFQGNGSLLTSITGANVTGTVANANYSTFAGTVLTASQPNITSVGTLSSLSVSGNITSGNANLGNAAIANYFIGDGSLLANLNPGNIGTVANANYAAYAGNVVTASQPNITSVGTLTSLAVTGNITAGNANLGNLLEANYVKGNGSLLTSITGANVTGTVANANYSTYAGTVLTASQPNITSVGTLSSVSVSGNITTGNASLGNAATANYFIGDGSLLSNLNPGNIGTVANANYAAYAGNVVTATQPNITSLGTLTSLTVSGDANAGNFNTSGVLTAGDATITGNLTVNGSTIYANVTTLNVKDPIIEMGGNPNGTPLGSNDGKDRGTLLHYYNTSAVDAFMGWDNSNAEFGFGRNVSSSSEVITWNEYGNIRANVFYGNGSQLTGIIANSNYAAYAGQVIDSSQPNITSVGTLSSLSVTANITAGNITGANLISANYFTGTLTTNAQPNITSLGSLTSLTVTGNITSGNANLGNAASANFFIGDGGLLSNINPSNIGTVANANYSAYTGQVITSSQPNITSVGTLSSLVISGNLQSANANLGNLVTANYFSGNGVLLTSITGANVTGTVANANYATYAGTAYAVDGANVSGSVANANYANYAGTAYSVSGGNVSGSVANANYANYAGTAYSVSGSNVSGDVSGANHANIADVANSVAGANVSGTVANANYAAYAGNVITASQPNITSVGTLSSLTVSGNGSFGNASLGNLATSNYFSGNGSLLTSITGANVTGTVANANYSTYAGTAYSVSGGNVSGQVANALVAGTVYTAAQPNITSVGTLTGLTSNGTVNFTNASNVSLGSNANVHITGGTNGYVIATDGNGNLTWVNPSSAGIAGSNTQVQFNDGSAFGASANFTFDKSTNTLTTDKINLYGDLTADGNITIGSADKNQLVNLTSNILEVRGGWNDANGMISLFAGDYANGGPFAKLSVLGNSRTISSEADTFEFHNKPNNAILLTVSNSTTSTTTTTGALQVSGGAGVTGNLNVGNLINATGNITTSARLISTVSTGTAPIVVSSTTKVTNLNADLLDGYNSDLNANASTIPVRDANSNVSVNNIVVNTGMVYGPNPNSSIHLDATVQTFSVDGYTNVMTINNSAVSMTGSVTANSLVANNSVNFTTASNVSLGSNTNVHITGGTSGYMLVTDGVGNLSWVEPNIGGGVGGYNTQVQFNDGNLFAGSANFTFNKTTNTLSVTNIVANGAGITYITGANVTGTVANANYSAYAGVVTTAAQPNITSVGTLSSLSVTGTISGGNLSTSGSLSAGDATITGNLTVNGTTFYANVTTLNVKDPIIEMGGNPNGTPLGSNDGKDRGTYLHYYSGGAIDAFMGWKNTAGEFVFASNANISSEVVTINQYGNVRASYFLGNGSQLTGTIANANYSVYAGTVTGATQSNITAVGTLTGLTSIGTINFIDASNVSLGSNANLHISGGSSGYLLTTDGSGNLTWSAPAGGGGIAGSNQQVQFNDGGSFGASGNFLFNKSSNTLTVDKIVANGSQLTSITGANVTGQVGNAAIAGTVYTAAQPNITSVGTLTSLSVTGNVTAGNVTGANLISANYLTGTLTTNAQPNITSVGTLSSLDVTGNITSGNANLGNAVRGNFFIGDGGLLSNIVAANISGTVANANYASYANVVVANAQPNITSVGALTSLAVIGNLSSGNANLGNLATANYFSGNGSLLSSITGGNVTGQVGNALVAGTVYTNAQPNITSVGTLTGLTLSGNLQGTYANFTQDVTVLNLFAGNLLAANYFSGDGSALSNVPADGGNSTSALYAGYVTGNAQPNITSVGTLLYLTVANSGIGNITADNANLGNLVTANYFSGNGSLLISINGANVTGTVANANYSAYSGIAYSVSGSNVSGSVANANYSNFAGTAYAVSGGNVSGSVANANYAAYAGNVINASQGNITSVGTLTTLAIQATGSVTGANLVSANYVTGTLTTGSQPNITSVGTLSSLTVSGTAITGQLRANNEVVINSTTGSSEGAQLIMGFKEVNGLTGQSNGTWNLDVDSSNNFRIFSVDALGVARVSLTAYPSNNDVLVGGNVTATYLKGDGGFISNLNVGAGSSIVNGNSNVQVGANGNVAVSVAGVSNTVVFTSTGVNVAGYVNATGNGTFGNISGGNLVSANYLTGTLTTNAQPNITSVGTLSSLSVTGNVSAGNFVGNGQYLTSINGANVTGTVANATYATSAGSATTAGTVTTASQPNITSTGTLTSLDVSGNATISGNLTVTGTTIYANITTLNVKDPVIEMGGNPNGTPLSTNDGKDRGTLLHYYVTANSTPVDAFMGWDNSNAEFGFGSNVTNSSEVMTFNNYGNVRASYFLGNGSQLTGTIAYSNYAYYAAQVLDATQSNITTLGTLTNVVVNGTGNVSGANYISGNYLTGTLTTGTQPNITSLGTLTGLTSNGTVNFTNATNVSLGSNGVVKITGGSSGYILTTDGSGGLSWSAPAGSVAGSNTQVQFNDGGSAFGASANFTFNKSTNTLTVTNISGNGALLTSITGANVTGTVANATYATSAGSATTAGTVTTASQPNITSVGTLSSLSVTGNITSGNANLGNLATANFFSGSGNLLSNIQGANVTGAVSSATTAGTVTTAAQPNITSLGTLTGLTSGGTINFTSASNVSLGAIGNLKVTGGSSGQYIQTDGAGNLSFAAVTATPGGSNTQVQFNDAGTLTGNAGLTFDKSTTRLTANNFTVTTSANLGAVGNVTITGGSNGYVLQTNGSGTLSWVQQTQAANITVDNFTGNGVQTVFTLSTSPANINATSVNYNGVLLLRDAYSISGANITFDDPPYNGSYIEVTTIGLTTGGGGGGGGTSAAAAVGFSLVFGA